MRKSLAECKCVPALRCTRLAPGKYMLGAEDKPVFVRLLRSHVMIRMGGAWDTFASYLEKGDPCRAKGKVATAAGAKK